jgi:AcrR family transcriptional regulator
MYVMHIATRTLYVVKGYDMPPRPKFTREQLQASALRIVDEEGLPALSMRTLAGVLGTGPMTIYNYIRDRDELEALVVDAVMAEAQFAAVEHVDWRVDVRTILKAMWGAVRAHPNVIPLAMTRRTSHEATLKIAEALLGALARSGRSGAALLAAFRTLNGFVMGLAQSQLADTFSMASQVGRDPHIARVEELPSDRFPMLREIACAAAQTDSDREFHAGLDIILAGIAFSS